MYSSFANKVAPKVFIYTLFLFSVSLLLPENFRNTVIFLFAFCFLAMIFQKGSTAIFKQKTVLLSSVLFILLSLSLLYTENIDYGFKRLIGMTSILVFPLSFSLYSEHYGKISHKMTSKIFLLFFASCVLFFLGVFVQNYFNGHLNEFIFRDYSERLNSKYGKYSLHPIYASLYIGISLLIVYNFHSTLKNKTTKMLVYFGTIVLAVILMVLARKSIIALMVLMFTFLFLKGKKKRHLVMYLLALIALIVVSYFIVPIRLRYIELYNTLLAQGDANAGSTLYRFNIYKCGINSVLNSPWFGFGLGDVKEILTECYINKADFFKGQYFNSHNQYISVWLASGIIGFLCLVSLMFVNIKLMVKKKFVIETLILLLFAITMLIENILERQSGVILFSFFINFFAFINPQNKE